MFALLISALLSTTQVDDFCQRTYGHPGDLGVTQEAAKYFTSATTYMEAAATIGMRGVEVPSNEASLHVYRWQDGQLEMHFRNQRLSMYRMYGQWKVFSNPVYGVSAQQSSHGKYGYNQAERRQEFEGIYKEVAKIVEDGRQVAEGQKERTDIRSLQFYLTKLRRAIDVGDWKQAEDTWNSMKATPALQRSHVVAADAKRRLTVRQRADEERRHREALKQRERIHKAEMRQQQEILDEMRRQRMIQAINAQRNR